MESLLRDILAELARIRECLERRPAPGRDTATAAALLRAIREHVQERSFTSFDLCDFVECADAVELGAAITAATGELSPRRVGKLLASIEGEPIEGLRVTRAGTGRQGVLWTVQVCKFANPQTSAPVRKTA
jgi:hypothetical protein